MNPWQMAQQIKHLLQLVTWQQGDRDRIFGRNGSVAVFAGQPTEEQIPAGFPWAMVGIDSADFDPENPTVVNQRFNVIVAAEVAGDRSGEQAIIGGPARDLGRSAGRGSSEIAGWVRLALQDLNGADGAKVMLSGLSTSAPTTLGRGRHMVMDELTFSAVCTSHAYYAAPQELYWQGGAWRWTGHQCQSRYDFVQFSLVRKAGEEKSRRPSDGTIVYTGTDLTWTGPQVGGSTYTIFAEYASRSGGTIESASLPEVGSYRMP